MKTVKNKLSGILSRLKSRSAKVAERLACVFFAVLLALIPTHPVSAALSDNTLDLYGLGGIYYYNPQGGGATCYSGNLSGDTIMAKVVSYLKGNNPSGFVLSDNGIAGILASFEAESTFNPFRFQGNKQSGPAYGIAQFDPASKILEPLRTDSRTANYYNMYYDIKYTHADKETGFPNEPVPMEVIDAWLAVQLDFFFAAGSEFETTKVGTYRHSATVGPKEMGLSYIDSSMTAHEAMDAAKTAEDAARIFVWIMERPKNKEGASNNRSREAQKWLNYVQQLSIPSGGASTGGTTTGGESTGGLATNGSQVTIIGDSLTVRATSQLEKKLPGADIHAQESKQFYNGTSDNPGGITILRKLVDNGTLRNTLVYALGTNGSFTSDQAQEVVDLAGSSRKVIFVNNWTTSNDYTSNNNSFAKMKNDNSNVRIADWRGAVQSHPDTYLDTDGVHQKIPEGSELFAQIIANAVSASGSNFDACTSMGLVEGGMDESQAQKLADYYNSPEITVADWGLPMSSKKNCTSFTFFFIQRFTSIGKVGYFLGNGKDAANAIAQKYSLPTGKEPRPYSVFSVTQGISWCGEVKCGHTGIVVGVEGNTITTVEAAWADGDTGHGAIVKQRNIDYFTNAQYGDVFTYLESILNPSDLTGF